MDEREVDERMNEKITEAVRESHTKLLAEMTSLFTKISEQHSNSNEEQLVKISSIVATGEMPKFKRRSNEEQYKLNSKVMLKLDEAEKSVDVTNLEKTKEKITEGMFRYNLVSMCFLATKNILLFLFRVFI
ncbi:MAG: hypothetical protein N0E48_14445 [Candidatus Thiodiazotropha endolucinida]|nr:hypothetical protein [Candidatus Thiodiazotropha taylori]MCW4344533.1 hypothetical protein [Candidatus Thiodiazotropha endolucinida]